ncbi:Mov34/MPN/PAD-1 family protein, partial [Ostertagia ostertagi]
MVGFYGARNDISESTMAATITTITPPNVSYIQMDSLVIMKIVKHVDSELYAGMSEVAGEACQGLLTGLVSVEKDDSRLEITNCLSLDRSDENAAQANQMYEELKQQEMLDMLRKFRNMNIDYELVGFYQAHPFGACFSQDLVDSMFDYQSNGPDGVVIIYDPVKTRQGQLCLRAYRLSVPALELCAKND